VSNIYPQQPWLEQLKTSFFSSPGFVIAKAPDNAKGSNALLFDVLLKGAPDIDERPEYYEPFEENIKTVFSKRIPLNLLFLNTESKEKLTLFYKQNGGKPGDYAYFPLVGNNKKDMIWVFNRSTAQPVEIVNSDPWQIANK